MKEKPKGGLTGTQLEIMEIFWRRSPVEATAVEVWQELQSSRTVARTTVLTLLQRLERRGWLTREGEGRGAIYRPAARPEETSARLATDFLASYFGGSASRLSHAVSRLERKGWVRREVQNSEVRCTEALLTEKGFAVLAAAAPDHVREARRLVFDAIAPEQVEQLRQITRQLLGAASPEVAAALDQAIAEAAAVDDAALDKAIVATAADSMCTDPEHLGIDH